MNTWIIIAFATALAGLFAESCHFCYLNPDTWIQSDGNDNRTETLKTRITERDEEVHDREKLLDQIDEMGNIHCSDNTAMTSVMIEGIPMSLFDTLKGKIDLLKNVIEANHQEIDQKILQAFLDELVLSGDGAVSGRVLWFGNGTMQEPDLFLALSINRSEESTVLSRVIDSNYVLKADFPWMFKHDRNEAWNGFPIISESYVRCGWSYPYYSCEDQMWLTSYTCLIVEQGAKKTSVIGVLSISVDVTMMYINQCEELHAGTNVSRWQMSEFLGTHKCDNESSKCHFAPGNGWTKGAYQCHCRDGFYSETGIPVFNGSIVETAFREKLDLNSPTYDSLYVCKKCQQGCDKCKDNSPCLSHYNWAFRISLLTISVICIFLTLILVFFVYRHRKLKVIKVASPVFLCITLLGCVIMYCEMAAIFPILDMYSCVATKWTRHMGFCITYSALLLKTWRVSLTYRVKSAHKLKLTDKQLLQWLFPILLVMGIYLGTWTISSPPAAIYIHDWSQLKFKQCDYSWWDHSLAIGEFLFLLWGIKVCYNVRNAESVFNEAKYISWAVHSITVVNIIMVLIHLIIFPNASPDVKYLFGFIRTQLSTTITIILIFGPKFYRVLRGQGDVWDNRARARGVGASFSLNGIAPICEEPQDLCIENEELKEEVQKLASQIEFMKIVHMEVNNRHLKPKHGGFFSQSSSNQSPVNRSLYMKFESAESAGLRISPAAELASEKV